MTKVLFIDDEPDLWIGRFRAYLGPRGLEFVTERDPSRASERIAAEKPDVVLLDSLFEDESGRTLARGPALLAEISARFASVPVVVFTSSLGQSGVDESDFPQAQALFCKDRFEDTDGDPHAELADALLAAVAQAADRRPLDERMGFVVGETPAMRRLAEDIIRFAPQDSSVLIQGATGTGKELVAAALHAESRRSGKLLALDCGRHGGDTLESTLFGHEKGAFTSAVAQHRGYFEEANKGTLFLDEIHAMSADMQDRLLRVVQDKVVRRVGGKADMHVDVRLVAASNRPLADLVRNGQFREDLYHRLAALKLELPALRDRLDDLPALFRVLVARLNKELNKRISSEPRVDVVEKLSRHPWGGNIRELENVLRHAMTVARANVLTLSTIELPVAEEPQTPQPGGAIVAPAPAFDLASRIMAGEAGWESLTQIHGPFRCAILVELFGALSERLGKKPGSKDFAHLLGINDGNMRQILRQVGGIGGLRTLATQRRRETGMEALINK